jgi:hypothetical protein
MSENKNPIPVLDCSYSRPGRGMSVCRYYSVNVRASQWTDPLYKDFCHIPEKLEFSTITGVQSSK